MGRLSCRWLSFCIKLKLRQRSELFILDFFDILNFIMTGEKNYLKIGFSPELPGTDRLIYRMLEIFPGALAWITLLGMVLASYFLPIWAAFFLLKTQA